LELIDINYNQLRKIQNLERKYKTFSQLEPEFYNKIEDYIEGLNKRLNTESSDHKKTLLDGEIQNTRRIINSIYEQREKKIVLAALTKARGGSPNLKNLLKSEIILFDSIYTSLIESRRKISKDKKEKSLSIKKQKNNKTVIRTIKNIPTFIGTDKKKYTLKNGDILTLNKDMTYILVNRGICKVLELD
jgi:DNA replication initiation complex subunit (GINS family)